LFQILLWNENLLEMPLIYLTDLISFTYKPYATSRKVAGSSPDGVEFSIDLILPAAPWSWGRLSL
jgi:hypothetical protein